MDTKTTWKSEIAAVLGFAMLILPALMEKFPAESGWAGAALAAAFILIKQLRKIFDNRSSAMIEAAKAVSADPSKPST